MKVLVTGCFDVIHLGHVRLLRHAQSLGDLTIALNTDESVRRLKGPSRPVNTYLDRVQMIKELGVMGFIGPIHKTDALELIHYMRPDIFVVGDEPHKLDSREAGLVRMQGGRVEVVQHCGRSTTRMVGK